MSNEKEKTAGDIPQWYFWTTAMILRHPIAYLIARIKTR
jgi:hypothetical protein